MKTKELDQFYTSPLTARKLTSIFTEKPKELDHQKTKKFKSKIIEGDVIKVLKKLDRNNKFDVIIADPPYNIGKDFGNNIDYRELQNYIKWSKN